MSKAHAEAQLFAQGQLNTVGPDDAYHDDLFVDEEAIPRENSPDTRENEERLAFVPPEPDPVGTISMCADPPRSRTWTVQVFLPVEAVVQFKERFGEDGLRHRSMLDERPARQLHDLVHDAEYGRRLLTMGAAPQIEALKSLQAEMPNAHQVVGHVLSVVEASLGAKVPLRLDPIILLGPPGGGKTRLCRRISEALNLPFRRVAMPNATAGATLFSGTDATWKACRPGVVAEMLMQSTVASPLIMLDEIDKSYVHPNGDHPLDPLHDLWEPENAVHFRDESLGVRFDASHLLWIATANDAELIRPSLLDRALVLSVAAPTPIEMEAVIHGMYCELAATWCAWFDLDPLPAPVIDHLRACHPRLARRVLATAMTIAASHHRHEIITTDIEQALALWQPQTGQRMGFV